jgi:O-antigen/teichoic acid export membrane protein
MSLTQRFARGVFWNLIGFVCARLFTFIAALVTARFLGKQGFGELGMVTSTVGVLGSFAGFGIGLTANKYVAELKESEPDRAGRIIALSNTLALFSGILLALTCILIAPWLAQKTLNAPHLTTMLQVGALIIPASALLGVQTGTLSGFQAFREITWINFRQGLLVLPLTISLVYSLGLLGAVLSLAITPAAGMVMAARTLRRLYANCGMVINYRQGWREKRILWDFTLPGVLSVNLINPVTWSANAILVNQPNGYSEMGLFNMANQLRMLIMLLPNIIGMVTVPLLSEIHGKQDPGYFAQVANLNVKTIWSFILPAGLLAIGFSSWLVGLYGPQFQSGRPVFALMVCASILTVVNGTIRQSLIAAGNMWVDCLSNMFWAIVLIISVLALVPHRGSIGLATAYFIAYSFQICSMFIFFAFKFGQTSIQSIPLLSCFTLGVLVMALAVGKVPEHVIISISLVLGFMGAVWFWRSIPCQNRQKILEFFRA